MGALLSPLPSLMRATTSTYQGKPCKNGHSGIRYTSGGCVECQAAKAKEWAKANPTKRRDINIRGCRTNRAKNPAFDRTNHLKQYGLTPESFSEILSRQEGKCACCGTTEPTGNGWQVDHDHTSGSVRGILCWHCNTGIGKLGDTLEGVKRAVRYLERYT